MAYGRGLGNNDSPENYAERLNSYFQGKEWPLKANFPPEELADTGLVYTGVEDQVTCTQCGFRHSNWPNSWRPGYSARDIARALHASYNPYCLFLQTTAAATVPSGNVSQSNERNVPDGALGQSSRSFNNEQNRNLPENAGQWNYREPKELESDESETSGSSTNSSSVEKMDYN